jgi:hypothetical protein
MSRDWDFSAIFNFMAFFSAIALEKIDSPCQIVNKKR